MKKPNLFLVGVPRSGTTSLYEYLKSHPEVYMSEVKGPNFFGEEANKDFPEYYKNKKKYLSLYKKVKDEKILGDASHYFISKKAPKQIKKFNPDAKILIILRNPFQVILSHYNNKVIPSNVSIKESLKINNFQVERLLERLKYSKHIKKYQRIFGKDQVYIMILEEFKKNPKKEYSKLCRFLEIKRDFYPEFKKYNPSKEIKNKWILKIVRIIPSGMRVFLKNILPKKTVDKIKEKIKNITTKKEIKIKKDYKKDLKFIENKLNKEIKRTEKVLGKKLWQE